MGFYKSLTVGLSILFGLNSCNNSKELASDIKISAMFSSNMVLQRDIAIPVWGKATPQQTVKVLFQKQVKEVISNTDSTWQVDLDPIEVGGPYDLFVIGKDTTLFANVLIGEVWVCSGQSNMEMSLAGWGKINNYNEEIAQANYPNIRLFTVNNSGSLRETNTIVSDNKWVECSPETVENFSASAYFFGRTLQKELNVPIGLIHSSVGGTPVEAWMPTEYIEKFDSVKPMVSYSDRQTIDEQKVNGDYHIKERQWHDNMHARLNEIESELPDMSHENFDDSKWAVIELPKPWENVEGGLGYVDGVVWFRKTINLSEKDMKSGEFTISVGRIHDANKTYINGAFVGESKTRWGSEVTEYSVPSNIVKKGNNTIAVKIENYEWIGGICGVKEDIWVRNSGGFKLNLSGKWKYKMVLNYNELAEYPVSPVNSNEPAVLFNGKINPIIPFAIKGAIWYQGEANVDRAVQYRKLFPTMITAWRERWSQGEFPFLYVQLANFMDREAEPKSSDWAMLREAQTMALSLPNTAMAVVIDIGAADDIHPKNKQNVGKRLALSAYKVAYNIDTTYSGPQYKSMNKVEGAIEIIFANIGSGLDIKNCKKLKGFAIAGDDMQFEWADAKIEGDKVIVWSNDILRPIAVRYAWADNPECNLYNKEGLPAIPFRTDK